MNGTRFSRLTDALDQAETALSGDEPEMRAALVQLTDMVRDQLAPLPEGEIERMAAEAEHAARKMAPPVPGVTANSGYIVHAVFEHRTAGHGWLESWRIAAERPDDGHWVTWVAYALDHPGREGELAYSHGHYYNGPDPIANKNQALADLAARAGLLRDVAPLLADEVTRHHPEHEPYTPGQHADLAMASRLRKWAARRLPDGV